MENGTGKPAPARAGRAPLDKVLLSVGVLLFVAVIGAGAYLTYSVMQARAIERGATPQARLIEELHERLEATPNDAALRVQLGEAYAASGRNREAIRELNLALELTPDHTGAYLVLGMIGMMERDFATADSYFLKIIELTEGTEFQNLMLNRELAFYYLGESALETGRYDEAIGYFKAAIRMNRGSAESYFGLGVALKGIEDYVGARDNLEIALAFDPNFPEAHYEMGQTYLAEGDRINAAVHLARAALLAPDNPLPAEALASLGTVEEWEARAREALADGDTDAALEAALITRALAQDDHEFIVLHGEVLEAMGEHEIARDVYAEAFELAPDDPAVKAAIERLQQP